jgi:hypothetical protein
MNAKFKNIKMKKRYTELDAEKVKEKIKRIYKNDRKVFVPLLLVLCPAIVTCYGHLLC